MSYRNPTQVVDTQTGQHYANLQKTIAGSFGNYANSVKAADAKKQQENEKKAAQETARLNGLIKERNKDIASAMRTDLKYPTVDFSTGAKGLINDSYEIESKNPIRSIDQNQRIAAANTAGDAARPAAEEFVVKQTAFNTAYGKAIGTMGGIANGQELKVYEGLYNSTPDGVMSKTTAIYTLDGSNNIVITYENGGKVFDPSNDSMLPQFVPDWQPSVDSFKKQGLTNELFNFADSNNEIYKGGEKIYENGRAVGVLPNRQKFEDSIRQGVKANVISGLSSNDAIALYNNVLRRPDKDGNMPPEIPQTKEWFIFDEDDESPEAVNQRKYQNDITNAATKFVANQAEYLKQPYKYTGKQGENPPTLEEDAKDIFSDIIGDVQNSMDIVGAGATFNEQDNTVEFIKPVETYETDTDGKQRKIITDTPMKFDLNTRAGMQDYVNSVVDRMDNLLGQKNGNKRMAIKKLVSGHFKDKKKESDDYFSKEADKAIGNNQSTGTYDPITGKIKPKL
jgi:hypothetical protein